MKATVNHSVVSGTITAPASKSYMQRACILALLRNGKTIIRNPSLSEDDLAVLQIVKKLGARVIFHENAIHFEGNPNFRFDGTLNCGESGLALRMLAPILAISGNKITLTGTGSLVNRPVNFLDKVLPALNVKFKSSEGFLPLEIQGPMHARNITVDGSLSSQFVTGMLISFSQIAEEGTMIRISGAVSKPYLQITADMLESFGYGIKANGENEFQIGKKIHVPDPIEIDVPGDWSGASFLLVAGAIAGSVSVRGLNSGSAQGDRAILQVLERAGAQIDRNENDIAISSTGELGRFTYDATDTPDLFPPLVALAAFCKGTTEIKGLSRLFYKESNRADSLLEVFSKMGVTIWVEGNSLMVEGGSKLVKASVDGHNDHRIVMAAAVAGLASHSQIVITGAGAVKKSYPLFFDDLRSIGAQVSLT